MSDFLRVENLFKSYLSGDATLEVLSGLSLKAAKGEMLAVTGESGSGKSTLLHLLGGMEKPDSGRVWVEDEDITAFESGRLAAFRNRHIGFVFQFHHLLPEFTALENVMFPLLIRGEAFPSAEAAGRGLLDEVGLADRTHHRPGELSGGEQQRVAIARALVGRPELLLADEPTGNLDMRTSRKIHALLREIHGKYGLTSILVTHNQSLADLCDRQHRLENGRLEEAPPAPRRSEDEP